MMAPAAEAMAPPRIDSHQHYWCIDQAWHEWPTPDLPALCRDFLPPELEPELERCGVHGTVLVQSQPDERDTGWMLDLAERTPSVLGVVGWTDLRAPTAPDQIVALAARSKLKGLRPMLQDFPPDWILTDEVAPALQAMVAHNLVLDALVRPQHLPAIEALADRYPALTIIVDHAAKPCIGGEEDFAWSEALTRLAERPNVVCKLSGLVTEAAKDWSPALLRPYVAHLLATFGSERVLWGSDWPVLLLRTSYATWHDVAADMIPHDQRANVFGANAARLYGLESALGAGLNQRPECATGVAIDGIVFE